MKALHERYEEGQKAFPNGTLGDLVAAGYITTGEASHIVHLATPSQLKPSASSGFGVGLLFGYLFGAAL